MVVPLLIYAGSFRRPEIYSPRATGALLVAVAPAQKAARRSSRCEVDGLRFSVYALLLAAHRLCLLGSPWFDPDAKPRPWMKASMSRPLASKNRGSGAACDIAQLRFTPLR